MRKHLVFFVVAILLTAAGLYVCTINAHSAKRQADHIVSLDKSGRSTASELKSLEEYAKVHVGASVTLTLSGSYTRAQAAARAAASTIADNSKIYADAQAACSGKSNSVVQAKCNQDYISAHLANIPSPSPVPDPKLADYQYKFSSPLWAPDLAGAILFGAIASALFAVVSILRSRR